MKKNLLLAILATAIFLPAAAQIKISGTVKTDSGAPVAGVTVSDGFTNVVTDAKGRYKMIASPDAMYVFYSVPAAYVRSTTS